MRGVVSGLIWGGVVSVFGLGVVSQLAPLPGAERAANDIVEPQGEPEPVKVPEPVKAPEPVVLDPEAGAEPAAEAPASAEAVSPPEAPPVAEPDAAAGSGSSEAVASVDLPETDAAPVPPAAPVTPPAPVDTDPSTAPLPGEMPAHSPLAPEVVGEPEAADPLEPLAPAEPLLDTPVPVVPEAVIPEAVIPEAVIPEPVIPEAAAPEAARPEAVAPEPDAPLAPAVGLPEVVEGVTTNRLPRIEPEAQAAADPAADPTAPPGAGAPEAEAAVSAEAAVADDRPLARFAAPFQNPANKPLYAILLLDDGAAGVDRAALAAMPLPLTIVLDPAAPEAGKLAAEYRRAGKEVAMLASGLPKGATPSDVQVSFQAHAKALPEAVAVVDLPVEGFQNNRKLAADLLPVIKDQGRGLVTFDKGLNAGDQVARREGVPAALIFRELDAEGEGTPLIRRYLDRAAFKAVQDGRVTVLGRARPETIAALLEWSVEGRAGSVALAPLTAVLSVPE